MNSEKLLYPLLYPLPRAPPFSCFLASLLGPSRLNRETSVPDAAHAACCAKRLARDPVRVLRRQENRERRNVLGLAEAPERCSDDQLHPEVAGKVVLSGGDNGEWTAHDLRRTAATMMQAMKVSPDVIDHCQNHVLPGSKVRKHYLLHDYAEEKRDASCLLGDRLDGIPSGSNVVAFRRPARARIVDALLVQEHGELLTQIAS